MSQTIDIICSKCGDLLEINRIDGDLWSATYEVDVCSCSCVARELINFLYAIINEPDDTEVIYFKNDAKGLLEKYG
jgi:hypothetical protein